MAHLLTKHPCFNKEAAKQYGRIHLPVAPRCNISCNYCNRKFDCANECRPGVTSTVLSPEEAMEKLRIAKAKMPNLTTVGIAGPGDSLANPEQTFTLLESIRSEFPDLYLCISTNGLMLPDYVSELRRLKAIYLTVTINTLDPEIGAEIYHRVRYNGKTYHGREGAEILLERQMLGLEKMHGRGFIAKVNSLLIPEVNRLEHVELAERVRSYGVHLFNIMPFIPVDGARFAALESPSLEELETVQQAVNPIVQIMDHCKQCRSDACGTLEESTTVNDLTAEPVAKPVREPVLIGAAAAVSASEEAESCGKGKNRGKAVGCRKREAG